MSAAHLEGLKKYYPRIRYFLVSSTLNLSLGAYCIECPDSYKTDPANVTLCDLNVELEMQTYEHEQNEEFIMQDNIQNITCQYSLYLSPQYKLTVPQCHYSVSIMSPVCPPYVTCPSPYLSIHLKSPVCFL